jgi:hypothetical protein
MMTMNKVMLWVVAAMAIAFVFMPPQMVAYLLPGGDREITADMTQTVLRVEGMT